MGFQQECKALGESQQEMRNISPKSTRNKTLPKIWMILETESPLCSPERNIFVYMHLILFKKQINKTHILN